jgi:membrane associated rhomboid family serine protease
MDDYDQIDFDKPEAEQWHDAALAARHYERQFQITGLAWFALWIAAWAIGFATLPFGVTCAVAGLAGGLVIGAIWGRRHRFAMRQHAELSAARAEPPSAAPPR